MKSHLSGQELLLWLSGTWCSVNWSSAGSKSRRSHRLLQAVADTGRLGIPKSHHPTVLQQVDLCGEQ